MGANILSLNNIFRPSSKLVIRYLYFCSRVFDYVQRDTVDSLECFNIEKIYVYHPTSYRLDIRSSIWKISLFTRNS